jgi:hypothetical protein
MAFYANVFVLSALFVCFAASIEISENDYPNVEVPGLAVPNLDESQEVDIRDDPKPCCLPKAWQGNISVQVGISGGRGNRAKLSQGTTKVFVDEDNKRIAGKGTGGRFRNETREFIVLFNADKTANLYLFQLASQKCWHKKLDKAEFRPQCIPENATLQSSFSLGPASGGLSVQSWAFRGRSAGRRGSVAFIGGKIVIVPTGCLPVLIQDHGMMGRRPRPGFQTNNIEFDQLEDDSESDDMDEKRPGHKGRGGGFVASAFFSDVKPSIDDPSVFTPPTFCNASIADDNAMLYDGEPMPDVLERFVSF